MHDGVYIHKLARDQRKTKCGLNWSGNPIVMASRYWVSVSCRVCLGFKPRPKLPVVHMYLSSDYNKSKCGKRTDLDNIYMSKLWEKVTCKACLKHIPAHKFLKREKEITFVLGNDWIGMYIDGKLKNEGHSLRTKDVVEDLGLSCSTITANEEWLNDRGRLPEKLCDVREEKE